MPWTDRRPSSLQRLLVAVLGIVVGTVAGVSAAASVSAHTDLDFTLPTDGAAVGEPVREITVGFTDPVTLIGPGFEVLDPQGRLLTPFVATDDDRVFRLQLDPPIGGGEAAVRYEVRAEDGHTISGGFSFTISAEAPTTTVAPPTTREPAPTSPPATPPPTVATTEPTTVAPSTTSAPPASTGDASGTSVDATLVSTGSPPVDDGGSSANTYLAVSAAVIVAAGAFLVLRSRSASRR